MGTRKAQHPPPPQLLLLILLSCPWIQGKEVGAWGWASRKDPRGIQCLLFSEHSGPSQLLGEGEGHG